MSHVRSTLHQSVSPGDSRPLDVAGVGIGPANLSLAALLSRLPQVRAGFFEASREFQCDAYGPTGIPLVARLGPHRRCVRATGGSGAGFRFAPAIAGRALRELEAFLPEPSLRRQR